LPAKSEVAECGKLSKTLLEREIGAGTVTVFVEPADFWHTFHVRSQGHWKFFKGIVKTKFLYVSGEDSLLPKNKLLVKADHMSGHNEQRSASNGKR
jgi:hypothetical protein